jgi:2-phospho-L-lactate/phosphoenolpyruvate guanylyltransferase
VHAASRHWCLVVPVKRLDRAKSRLEGTFATYRRDLALAFALDTVAAALSCPVVAAVLVVTDEPEAAERLAALGAEVTGDDPDAGLNPALTHGAGLVVDRHPGTSVGTIAADLPALRPDELTVALGRAGAHPRAFVRDAEGSGTTLLLARSATDLRPGFGPRSAQRHLAGGAVEVPAADLPSVRADVDRPADLEAAVALGVGQATAAVLAVRGR